MLSPIHKSNKLIQQYNEIYDKLALIYYTLRTNIISQPGKGPNILFPKIAEVICATFIHVVHDEFDGDELAGHYGFLTQTESYVQELIIGFSSESGAFHEAVCNLYPETTYFTPIEKIPESAKDRELMNALTEAADHKKHILDRHRVLFETNDTSVLLGRAMELRKVPKTFQKNSKPVKYTPSTRRRDAIIKAGTICERAEKIRQAHSKEMRTKIRSIIKTSTELEANLYHIQSEREKLLQNKEDINIAATDIEFQVKKRRERK